MKKILVILGLVSVSFVALADQGQKVVCVASCLISWGGEEYSGTKILVKSQEDTKGRAVLSLANQCEALAAKERLKIRPEWLERHPITGQLFTSFDGSRGGSWQSTGNYIKYEFNAAAACAN